MQLHCYIFGSCSRAYLLACSLFWRLKMAFLWHFSGFFRFFDLVRRNKDPKCKVYFTSNLSSLSSLCCGRHRVFSRIADHTGLQRKIHAWRAKDVDQPGHAFAHITGGVDEIGRNHHS